VLRRPGLQHLCELHLQAAERDTLKANVEFKVLLRDGDALITRARANLMTQFLDDPRRRTSCSSMPISAFSRSRCFA